MRGFFRVGIVVTTVAANGCAQTWDTIGSKGWQREFTRNPLRATITPDDPLTILRERPDDGDARVRAMRRLDEPVTQGRGQEDQKEALDYLAAAAASDPSPVVRAAAIDALGRFQDPRVPELLVAAFHQAAGPGSQRPADTSAPGMLAARSGLFAPSGYSPDVATMLRVRTVDALAKTGRPEAVAFLAELALPKPEAAAAETRDVRVAAVRGLTTVRRPEAVTALARILDAEKGRDAAIVTRAHAALQDMTGRDLPADPRQWNEVVQAGFDVRPEPNSFQRAASWIMP